MIITRAMPTQQTAITGVSRRITAGQEIKAELCRGPGVQVDAVGGADVLVAEPEGDGRGVDAVTAKGHGAAVPQGVWADRLAGQGWAGDGCGGDVALDQASDGVAAERSPGGAGEQWIGWRPGPLGEPGVY